MSGDMEFVLLFGGLHLFGLILAAVLFVLFVRSDTSNTASGRDDGESDDNGGGSDRLQPLKPWDPGGDGPPLPDADPSKARLRTRERLADVTPPHSRRPSHPQPAPEHVPATTRHIKGRL